MLSKKVKERIETYSREMLESNPFAVAAKEGRLTEKNVVLYLKNLMWIFQEHSLKINQAYQRAKVMGLHEVEKFMIEKYEEELDHYKWPEEDLRNLGVLPDPRSSQEVTNSASHIITFINQLIQKDPSLFIVYMVFVEYFTVLAAPEFLRNMETKCGISSSYFTAISKHVIADEKHVSDGFKMIVNLDEGKEKQESILQALEESIQYVDQFFCECAVSQ